MDSAEDLRQLQEFIRTQKNWGRWGEDDQIGAVNLVTEKNRLAAAALVTTGLSVSFSRPFPVDPAPNNPNPAEHRVHRDAVMAADYYGIEYHGMSSTHIDALCHVFDEHERVWNGRGVDAIITPTAATWGGVEQWKDGIVTRAVLLDVPAFRGERYVDLDRPVTEAELDAVARAQGTALQPGDALLVYSGRDVWDHDHRIPWGGERNDQGQIVRPGLHPSCLRYVRRTDCAVLAWDMMDVMPHAWGGLPWNTHGSIYAFGVALIDNCDFAQVVSVCRQENRYEFMFVVSPLVVHGGTGSPVNPLAIF